MVNSWAVNSPRPELRPSRTTRQAHARLQHGRRAPEIPAPTTDVSMYLAVDRVANDSFGRSAENAPDRDPYSTRPMVRYRAPREVGADPAKTPSNPGDPATRGGHAKEWRELDSQPQPFRLIQSLPSPGYSEKR